MDSIQYRLQRKKLKYLIAACCNDISFINAMPSQNYYSSLIIPIELVRKEIYNMANPQQQYDINELMAAADAITVLNKVMQLGYFSSQEVQFDFSICSVGYLQEFCDILRTKVFDIDAMSIRHEHPLLEEVIWGNLLVSSNAADFHNSISTISRLMSKYWAECLLDLRENGMCVDVDSLPTLMWDDKIVIEIPESNSSPFLFALSSYSVNIQCKPLRLSQGVSGYVYSNGTPDFFQKFLGSLKTHTVFLEAIIMGQTGTKNDPLFSVELIIKAMQWSDDNRNLF